MNYSLSIAKFALLSLMVGITVQAMEPVEPIDTKQRPRVTLSLQETIAPAPTPSTSKYYLSLISNDNKRFWIAPEVVAKYKKLQELYTNLDDNKYIRTNLDGVTLHLFKDLIDASSEQKELQPIISDFGSRKNLTLAQCAALLRESTKLQLPLIAQETAGHIYDTQSEFGLKEFQDLGSLDLAYCKLMAIQTGDRVFIMPEATAKVCPYLQTMLDSSLHESKSRILKVTQHSTSTIRFIKKIIESLYQHTTIEKNTFDQIKPLLEQSAQEFQDLSVEAIGLADQWQLPEVAHLLTQIILENKPAAINEVKKLMPAHYHKYIPPFKAEDAQRLKDHTLSYLGWIAKAQQDNYFDASQKALGQKLIDMVADNFDDHIREGTHAQAAPKLERLFQKPRMRSFAVALNKKLVEKNKITQDAPIVLQPYADLLCHMKFSKINAEKFVVFAKNENPQIWNVHGQHMCTLRSDLLETMNSAVAYGPNRVITASYYKGILARDENVYLKFWSIKNGWTACLKTITTPAPGRPDIRLKVLADGKVAVGIYQSIRIWNPEMNEIKFAEPAQESAILAELESPRDGTALDNEHSVMTQDFPGPCWKMVIRQSNDLLPIQEIIKKRKEQMQREQESCSIL